MNVNIHQTLALTPCPKDERSDNSFNSYNYNKFMAGLKSLLKDTAIYGISSIVGRFLNYLLVPIYAASMSAASGGYGVVTEVYAWTALLMVILTYGMETSFFRFVNKEEENPKKVYSTVLTMVGGTSLLFATLLSRCSCR